MKVAVIGILLLFVGIFAAKQVFEYNEKKSAERAHNDYTEYVAEREKVGDTLSKDNFLKTLSEQKLKNIFDQPLMNAYLSPEGYVFNAAALEHQKRRGEVVARKKFNSRVGRFGPKVFTAWKPLMSPRVVTNPSDRMLASKIVRHLGDWKKRVNDLTLELLEGVKLNANEDFNGVAFGLYKTRQLEEAQQKAIFKKLEDLLRVMVVMGKLEFHKGGRSTPYTTATDLMLISDRFAQEAVTELEVETSLNLDSIMLSYVSYIGDFTFDAKAIKNVQRALLDVDLSATVFNAVRLARISSKAELENKMDALAKREIDSLNIFDSGFLVSGKEKGEVLLRWAQAGTLLMYASVDSERPYTKYEPSVLKNFGEFANSERDELDLNRLAIVEYNGIMRKLENAVNSVLIKQARRHEVAVKLAIKHFHTRKGVYPESLDDLTAEDIPEVPLSPFTGKPYLYEFKNPTPEQIKKEPSLKRHAPAVEFLRIPRSVITPNPKAAVKS